MNKIPSSPLEALSELAARFDELVKRSPAADLEKNARAQFVALLAKQGLVTRDQFEIQSAMLEKAQAKLAELEARIAALESAPERK